MCIRENKMKRVRIDVESNSSAPPQAAIFTNISRKAIKSSPFRLYKSRAADKQQQPSMYAVGHTDRLEFVGESLDALPVRYAVGVYQPSEGRVVIYDAPLFEVGTTVKRLRTDASKEIAAKNALARRALGEAFGTKKRRRQLQAVETNAIDVAQDLQGSVLHAFNETVQAISAPTQDDHKIDASDRLIPPFNAAATCVGDIYPLDGVVPPHELAAISLNQVLRLTNKGELDAFFTEIRAPAVVIKHVHAILRTGARSAESKLNLRILLYVTYMYRLAGAKPHELGKMDKLLYGVPSVIVECLRDRFTAVAGTETEGRRMITDSLKDLIWTHMFCLILRVCNWEVDPKDLKDSFGLTAHKTADLLKELGCQIETLTKNERMQSGITAKQAKKARLTIPFQLPQARVLRSRS
ncbi:hypothetical protein SeMB42_g00102 [Synchytrium endobioticum]|uniref:RNA polymerase I associated factor, A49-like protein n=1 Tax=Synchytrium endobioticum TaxID=286115 RepID=A0A507DT30_9FUNG|nr:hypothetical protein SeLEV6574_g00196 [Synchytrium endobioticum]TPX54863.1 hypothetical protein SeMB42_g00099 [Synchytrium endobioticum]TPX54909.1 hypothetical protein SeMB42_g00105 [Synchytrium endobioticum]TPX54915.1 hypothetical protein SeMB42_g00102 [Synchytrium endobioticum]